MSELAKTHRASWVAPQIVELPPLTALTLQTGGAVNGAGSSTGVGFSFVKLISGGGEAV